MIGSLTDATHGHDAMGRARGAQHVEPWKRMGEEVLHGARTHPPTHTRAPVNPTLTARVKALHV
jgi:hypothetical protein